MRKFLRTVLLIDLLQGFWFTLRNRRPNYIDTEQYPAERSKVAERFKGGRFPKELACPWHGADECR